MALDQFNTKTLADTSQAITAGTSPYYDMNTGLSTTPVTAQMPTYTAPKFTTGQETFNWDPNQYLPAIQQQAKAIYQPQQAQLEALRQLTASQAEQSRVVTKEDFAKQMNSEIEAINQRGAFFSGGALNKQAETATAQTRALQDITTQWNAANFANIAQQAGLSAAQTEYISSQLSGAKGSAYDIYNTERSAFQTERSYQQQVKQWEEEMKLRKKELKAQGKSDKAAAKKAQKEFDEKKRQFDLEYSLKQKEANKSGSSTEKGWESVKSTITGDVLGRYNPLTGQYESR